METKQVAYDACRYYLLDNKRHLDPTLFETILGFLRSRNLEKLCSASVLYREHHSVEAFRVLKQVESFFKKNEAFSDDESCTQKASESFFDSESRCRRTNRRLSFYYLHRDRLDPDLELYMRKAESFIRRVLGPHDPFISNLPRYIRVTDGATASRSRRRSLPYLKVKKGYQCSAGAVPYLQSLSRFFGYGDLRLWVSPINRVEVVPKNWKTHRTIACEPDGNLPFQLAFDSYAKDRLRRFGIDLSDQFRNQDLAKQGSISGSLATIDLSSASDTVAYNTVAWLFPQSWFRYLCSFRSTCFKGAFGYGSYSKFSSMGNGSTFAIETLVFAAACSAVGSRQFSVYGDDIVIEAELYDKLVRFLRFLGFVVNQDKSFHTGPYRESCGKHWFKGIDVTPFYVRGRLKMKPELSHVVNGLVTIGQPLGYLWDYCKELISQCKLPYVPYNNQTTSGIFLDVQTSYSLKLIKTLRKAHMWIPQFKSFQPKGGSVYIGDLRTLFLWHLDAFRIRIRNREREALVRSRVPLAEHRYVRKWVGWRIPAGSTPDHLIWWSEYALHK